MTRDDRARGRRRGRKPYAIVVDALGTLLGAAAAGPSNWELVGVDGARDTIAGAADHALAEAGVERSALDASVLGLAGVDRPSDVERLERVIGPLGLGGVRRILNDAFVALRAGTTQPWGICVIAGTGTVTAGRASAPWHSSGSGAERRPPEPATRAVSRARRADRGSSR